MPIYKQTTEITKIDDVWANIDRDIVEVYFGDKNIFTVWGEYDGSLPITINANGNALLDYRIYGNTVQNGTPTPENPIMPEGVGERTENLFEVESDMLSSLNWGLNSGSLGEFFINYKLSDAVTQELKKGQHTCSIFRHFTDGYDPKMLVCGFSSTNISSLNYEYRILTNNGKTYARTFDFSEWQDIYLIIGYGNGFRNEVTKQQKIDELFANWGISIVAGSIAPTKYEPYGYKLPMTVSDGNTVQTIPIYLDEVETTRRIKKLVLTGEETVQDYSSGSTVKYILNIPVSKAPLSVGSIGLCTHYLNGNAYGTNNAFSIDLSSPQWYRKIIIKDNRFTTADDFRNYLSAQYAAGTPITVWYVLAESETAVVNEPLMKIGDYADTLSMEQADVNIPTFAGTTVIDYDGTPKPSQMYVKYRKQHS